MGSIVGIVHCGSKSAGIVRATWLNLMSSLLLSIFQLSSSGSKNSTSLTGRGQVYPPICEKDVNFRKDTLYNITIVNFPLTKAMPGPILLIELILGIFAHFFFSSQSKNSTLSPSFDPPATIIPRAPSTVVTEQL